MEIKFNPITFSLDVVKKAYPELNFDFEFAYLGDESVDPKEYTGPWGAADFESETPSILIDPRLPICAFPEIFFHELAHVLSGFDEGHSSNWNEMFENLHTVYHEMFEELYADPDA